MNGGGLDPLHHGGGSGGSDQQQHSILEEDDSNATARIFFERFVAPRRPCVLQWKQNGPQQQHSVQSGGVGAGASSGCNEANTTRDVDNSQKKDDCIGRMEYTCREWFPQASRVNDILTHWMKKNEMLVQVERRTDTRQRFGQARSRDRQVTLPLSSLVKHYLQMEPNDAMDSKTADSSLRALLNVHPSLYYLSTQDDVCDTAGLEAESLAPPEPYWSEPCRTLRDTRDNAHQHLLPSALPLAGHLMLHQCQVWMGYTARTNSNSTATVPSSASHSGLHHDYHDNFYTVLAGVKEFILYPPSDAPRLAVAGDIHTMHANGLISYQNAPIRADGRPIVPVKDTSDNSDNALMEPSPKRPRSMNDEQNESEEVDDDDDDEQEVVLGRGFDYQSDSDDDNVDWNDTTRDDFDKVHRDDDDDDESNDQNNDDRLPNHFSRLDPTVPHTTVPFGVTEYRVRLCAGDTLYLPASWFHCVVSHAASTDFTTSNDKDATVTSDKASSGDTSTATAAIESKPASSLDVPDNTTTSSAQRGSALTLSTDTPQDIAIPPELHMAVNYWYHPPDNLDNYQHPYRDVAYWESSRTERVETHLVNGEEPKPPHALGET
jgi:Cupin-like domain